MQNNQTFAFTRGYFWGIRPIIRKPPIIPALINPSLIVLDNASYHNVKTEDTVCPNFNQKKAVLQNYLTQHNIPFSATALSNTTKLGFFRAGIN
jgi:hypothetical protein